MDIRPGDMESIGDVARLHRAQRLLPRDRRPRSRRTARSATRRVDGPGPQDLVRLGGLARGAPPHPPPRRPRLRPPGPVHHRERLRVADRPGRRRARARRGPGGLPGRAHRPGRAGDRRRLRRPRLLRVVPARQLRVGGGLHASASGSCGSTSTATAAGSSRTAAGGCATSSAGAGSTTTMRSTDPTDPSAASLSIGGRSSTPPPALRQVRAGRSLRRRPARLA